MTFLGKREFRKNEDDSQYKPVTTKLWRDVATVRNLNETFVGSYRDDYQNTYDEEGECSCCSDKYSTVIILTFHVKEKRNISPCNQFLIMRWLKTGGEMHYLPLSKLQQRHTEVVDNTPAVFLPTKILELTC